MNLAIGMPGVTELLLIGGVLILLFGARKLPELARAMGSSITQFKKGLHEPEGGDKLPPGTDAARGAAGITGEGRRESGQE